VVAESEGGNRALVARENAWPGKAVGCVPEPHDVVRASGGEPGSVRAEGHVPDSVLVAAQEDRVACRVGLVQVHHHGVVMAWRDGPTLVRAERDLKAPLIHRKRQRRAIEWSVKEKDFVALRLASDEPLGVKTEGKRDDVRLCVN